jgi:hypothetical protein
MSLSATGECDQHTYRHHHPQCHPQHPHPYRAVERRDALRQSDLLRELFRLLLAKFANEMLDEVALDISGAERPLTGLFG